MLYAIEKFPRTPHLEGSRLQVGDQDLSQIKFGEIAGRPLVIEEKVDGANCGISFDADSNLRLQSRGHYLTGGPREKQFALLKQWASEHQTMLRERLENRFVMYGEWMYAKHTVFYNQLPAYFLEFDIFDTVDRLFLDTDRRRTLLSGLPVHSVPVLHQGITGTLGDVASLLQASSFINQNARTELSELAGPSVESVIRETDLTGLMEGLYIKIEQNGVVTDRLKYVRASFLAVVDQSGSHWTDRPMIRNRLRH